MMKKGICIVVSGHAYYGRFAYNLCASIKAIENFPVCLIYNGNVLAHLSADKLELFDYIVQMDSSISATQMCKLYVTEYTPFEQTLLLDADMLWLPKRKPSELFEEVEGQHFASITEGKETDVNKAYFFWADPGEIKTKYKCESEIHQWRSEVVYFDDEGAKVLRRALEICKKPGLDSVKNFAHSVPDELGINIATAEMGIVPHKYKWQPSYWPNMTGGIVKWGNDLHSNYYLISFGSNSANGTLKRIYGQLTQSAFNKIKRQNIFPLIEKKSFLPTIRNKM
jgi:hypothetical protein